MHGMKAVGINFVDVFEGEVCHGGYTPLLVRWTNCL